MAVAAYVVLPVAGAAVLHRLGSVPAYRVDWSHFGDWLATSPFESALVALLRSAGLLLAYWLIGTTATYLIARALGWVRLANSIGWLTLPAVRRASDRVVAGTLALSTLAAPGVASTKALDHGDSSTPVPDPYFSWVEPASPGEIKAPTEDVVVVPAEEATAIPVDPPVYPDPDIVIVADASLEVVVRPGDNLWDLAARRIQTALGREVADTEVAPYWVEVIHANQQRIRSGDPDLIHPGEVILLPPVRV